MFNQTICVQLLREFFPRIVSVKFWEVPFTLTRRIVIVGVCPTLLSINFMRHITYLFFNFFKKRGCFNISSEYKLSSADHVNLIKQFSRKIKCLWPLRVSALNAETRTVIAISNELRNSFKKLENYFLQLVLYRHISSDSVSFYFTFMFFALDYGDIQHLLRAPQFCSSFPLDIWSNCFW